MGDRGNIAVLQSDNDQIWLYSHWAGSDLPDLVKRGLAAAKKRWDDEPYLTRQLFGSVIPPGDWKEEGGWGIAGRMGDNEHPITVVDIPNQRVYFIEEDLLENGRVPDAFEPEAANECQSFADYIK